MSHEKCPHESRREVRGKLLEVADYCSPGMPEFAAQDRGTKYLEIAVAAYAAVLESLDDEIGGLEMITEDDCDAGEPRGDDCDADEDFGGFALRMFGGGATRVIELYGDAGTIVERDPAA